MSLFKQISILLGIVFTLIFIFILSISFNVIKTSAQKFLYENVQNSVSNISLSITNAIIDESTIKTILNASFDNGNYEKIVFKDLNNKVVFEKLQKEKKDLIPKWFLNFVEVSEVSASSNISQGWNVVGTLVVYADRETLYVQIYKIFINLSITIIFLLIFSLIFSSLLFKRILKPLKDIERQSDLAIDNKFIYQKKLPFTLEFKSVANSMNSMVEKAQNMFNHANDVLIRNRELLYIDELTKLYNRNYFILKASEYLDEESINNSGFVLSINITRIDLLNRKIGYENVNNLFSDVSNLIRSKCLFNNENIISRTNAGEFIILFPRLEENNIRIIAKQISIDVNKVFKSVLDEDIKLFFGVCNYQNEKTYSELLSKIDYTLNQSKVFQGDDYFYFNDNIINEAKDKFREIISTAQQKEQINILYRNIFNLNTNDSEYKTISFEIKGNDKVYSYGEFVGIALDLNLLEDIYLKVIEKILKEKSSNCKVSIQIPNNFIANMPFEKIRKVLEKNMNSQNIIFELEEESFSKYYFNCIWFLNILEDKGFNIAIFNFMGISKNYDYLKIKKPEYIKISHNFLSSLRNLDAVYMIKNSLSIKLIATSINNIEEFESIKNKDIKLVSGRFVDKLLSTKD